MPTATDYTTQQAIIAATQAARDVTFETVFEIIAPAVDNQFPDAAYILAPICGGMDKAEEAEAALLDRHLAIARAMFWAGVEFGKGA